MKIKPLFFTVVLAAAVLCFATSVNAQTSTQSQIDALLKQISEASAQLKTLQSQQTATSTTTPTTPTTSTWCHTFNTNLGYAQSGTAEIGYLHTALQKQGISYAPDTGNVYANGTSQGVIQFQKKYGIFQTGYVGNATRTQLNSLYGCANTGATSSYSKAAEFGSLVISKDASSPASDILVAGQTATLGVFRLSADYYESLDVDEITISSNYPNIVDTFYFYNGSVLLGSVSGSASATLTLANGTLIIPANSNVKITVKVKIVSSVINGTFVFADLKNDAVKTTGLVSAKPVNSGSQTASSNQMVAYNSRPYFSLSSVSPSGQLIPTANTLLAVFDVKADANGDIAFENNNGSSLSVNINRVQKDADGASQTYILKDGDGTKLDATSVSDTATSVIFDFADSSLIVPAGLTGKLYIYGDTTDLEDSGDAIQLWLDDSNASNVKWGIDGVGSFGEADKIFRGDIFAKTLIKPDGTTQTTCNTQNQCVLGGGGKVCTASSECVTTTPTITVISPNGGEIWQIGETHNITWTSTGMTKVAINLKDYSGANHNYGIASGLNALLGTYSWTVPDNVYVGTGSQYKLEISEYTTSGIYVSDSSDNYFSITSGSTQPSLTVRTPNGGESWTQGTTQNIKWDYNGVGKINIYLVYANGTLCYLTNVPAQQALYSYIMGTVCPDGTGRAITPGQYKIMVTESPSSAHNPPSDSSDNYFSIVAATAQPNVTVTSPNGAEQWQQGTTKTISWQSAGLLSSDKIDVWLWSYTDSSSTPFATDVIVSGLVGNSTLYNWAIPKNLSGARYKIDIEVHRTSGSSLTYDQSDNYFSIVSPTTPTITVTSPNGGESWKIGETQKITWTSTGVGNVGIYLAYQDDTLCYLTNVPSSQGSYSYTIGTQCPDGRAVPKAIVPGQYKIFISENPSSVHNPPSDYSDNYFNIVSATTTCVDSDGGKNYDVKGTASTSNNQNSDRCYDSAKLMEFYCNPADPTSANYYVTYTCPNGCENGVCKSSPASPSPIAYYAFDDNANDSSGNNYNGTTNGGPALVTGVSGQAYSFDGVNDYISIGNTISITSSFTATAWAKSAISNWNAYGWITSSRVANGFIISPILGSKRVDLYVINSTSGIGYTLVGSCNPSDITVWHQYGVGYDSVQNKAFVICDGSVTYKQGAISRGAGTIALDIGRDYGYATKRYGSGSIDEVKIWNSALSTADISNECQKAGATVGVMCAPPPPTSFVGSNSLLASIFDALNQISQLLKALSGR